MAAITEKSGAGELSDTARPRLAFYVLYLIGREGCVAAGAHGIEGADFLGDNDVVFAQKRVFAADGLGGVAVELYGGDDDAQAHEVGDGVTHYLRHRDIAAQEFPNVVTHSFMVLMAGAVSMSESSKGLPTEVVMTAA